MADERPADRGRRTYFEDLAVGQVFDKAPALTLTEGDMAPHQALLGDCQRLALECDAQRGGHRTGRGGTSIRVSSATSSSASRRPAQRVRGNLFYRGLALLRPLFVATL